MAKDKKYYVIFKGHNPDFPIRYTKDMAVPLKQPRHIANSVVIQTTETLGNFSRKQAYGPFQNPGNPTI